MFFLSKGIGTFRIGIIQASMVLIESFTQPFWGWFAGTCIVPIPSHACPVLKNDMIVPGCQARDVAPRVFTPRYSQAHTNRPTHTGLTYPRAGSVAYAHVQAHTPNNTDRECIAFHRLPKVVLHPGTRESKSPIPI